MSNHFASTPLVRLLGGWTPVGAPSGAGPVGAAPAAGMDFAERLSLWVGPLEAIALQSAMQSLRQVKAPQDGAKPKPADLAEDVERVRAALAHAIAQDPLPAPAPGADLAKDAAWSTYLQRHLELQRKMARLIDPLREHVRQSLGRSATRLRQLAAMDTVLAETLAARQERLLPTPASLLQRRYEQLCQAHLEALQAATTDPAANASASADGTGNAPATDDPTQWRARGAWLHRFEQDWRQALIAEVDLRLEPVLGMVEALSEDLNDPTP